MIDGLRDLTVENDCRLVYAPNFSMGVSMVRRLAVHAARLLTPLGYDVAVEERHHERKGDVSGTGRAICSDIIEADIGKTAVKLDGHDEPRQPHEITLSVTRARNIPGTHTVLYDGPSDTIEIVHRVRDRGVFAEGAVNAALKAKEKPPGAYVLEQLLT